MARVCCQELFDKTPAQPFSRIIALSWNAGMEHGVMACGACGTEYSFQTSDTEDEDDARTLELARLPDETIDDIVEMLSEHLEPSWPIWVPDWRFGTLEIRTSIEESISELLEEADALELRVLWSLADNVVLAAARIDDE